MEIREHKKRSIQGKVIKSEHFAGRVFRREKFVLRERIIENRLCNLAGEVLLAKIRVNEDFKAEKHIMP